MRILTVYDSETVYTEAFVRMLSREKNFPFEVHAFTDLLKMENFIRTKHPSMTLVAEKDFIPEMTSWPSDCFMILREDRNNPECDSIPGIRKYQPFPAVLQSILLHADPSVLKALSDQTAFGTQVIGVGSPVRRCGNTLFSLALARLLSDTRPTLFITADPCSGFSERFRFGVSKSMSDLLYDLASHSGEPPVPEMSGRLDGMTVSLGPLRVLAPFPVMQDAMDLVCEDLPDLFVLCGRCRIQTVVLDAGLLIYDPVPLIQMCSRFYMPSLPDPLSSAKMSSFADSLKKTGQEDLLDRITPVRVPWEEGQLSPGELADQIGTLPVAQAAMQIIGKDRL